MRILGNVSGTHGNSLLLRRVLILAAVAFLIWRVGTVGVSSHYAQSIIEREREAAGVEDKYEMAAIREDNQEAADQALIWDDRQPEALYLQALALQEDDPDAASALLVQANANSIADARPFLAAAYMASARDDWARADALVETALQLEPAAPRVLRGAGGYWALRGDVEQALRYWSLALEADSSTSRGLFPLLLELVEDAETRPAFEAIAASPPSWWDPFFTQVAQQTREVETITQLYSLRRKSQKAPITLSERTTYVTRLLKEGLIDQAYIVWVNGLVQEQRKELGLLYNGGFELEPEGWGFGWHIRPTPRALIGRAYIHGTVEDKSLHLLFERHRGRFDGLHQMLSLGAGTYRLSGKILTEDLDTDGGIQWVIRCALPEAEDLGRSAPFLGTTGEWKDFDFQFEVPDTCTLQEIRLISAGKRPHKHRITGEAWFDHMIIRKKPKSKKVDSTKAKKTK